MLEELKAAEQACIVAERIVTSVRRPIALGEPCVGDVHVGISIGIAFAELGIEFDALLRNADAAMYQAKAAGNGRFAVFRPTSTATAVVPVP